jgi:DNA-3-methyladenine glycosylase I
MTARDRCGWAASPEMAAYHDAEWGMPLHDDRALFELLTLEGAQAGLSWAIVLRKREGYRAAFEGFDPAVVASYDAARIDALTANPAIVRHRGKIESTVKNARAVLAVQAEFGGFGAYLWQFVDGRPVAVRRPAGELPPARTALSVAISADLKRRGFSFVGSTIIYAFLQASGIVDDHDAGCWRVAHPK